MPLITEPVAASLKAATAISHREAESVLIAKLTGIRSLHQYAAILKSFYGYFFPLQQIIARHISRDDLPDIDERRQALLLLRDLESLDMPASEMALCALLPAIENKAQAFGALYVLEGSTLGGRTISHMLMKNRFIELGENNLQFFAGYKEETGARWKRFTEALNRQTETEEIIAAARETFGLFKNWIKRSLYHEHTL